MAHIAEDMRALRKTFPRGIFTSAKDRATLSDRKLVRFDVPAAALTSITSYYIGNAAPDPVWLETTGGPQCAGFFRYVRATFMTATGLSVDYSMFNGVGLKRRGFPRPAIVELKAAFQEVFFTPGNIRHIAAALLASGRFPSAEARRFLEFFAGGKRSFARARRAGGGETDDGA